MRADEIFTDLDILALTDILNCYLLIGKPKYLQFIAFHYFQIKQIENIEMTNNSFPRLEKWQDQTKNLVEQDGIRPLCLYLDQKTGKVNLLADSESQNSLGQSRAALKELENILESKVDEKEKLSLYNHNQVREDEEPCSKSIHSCHHPAPMFQLAWEKNLPPSCFAGKKWFPDVKDYDKLPAEILKIMFGFLKPDDLKKVLCSR